MNKGKKIKTKWKTGICEVHYYGLGNNKKRKVFFCPDCSAFMCSDCSKNIVLRVIAMTNRSISKKLK